jgi:hypothetical protein
MTATMHTMALITRNKSNRSIARDEHDGRRLIRHVREGMSDADGRLTETSKPIGHPPKVMEVIWKQGNWTNYYPLC